MKAAPEVPARTPSPRRYRKRLVHVDAVQFTADPLPIVKLAAMPDTKTAISLSGSEIWLTVGPETSKNKVAVGDYVVRDEARVLIVHTAAGFEAAYEPMRAAKGDT